jgi:ribosomal protein S27AE
LHRGTVTGVIPPDPLPDATDPTTECARCTSNAIYMTQDGRLVCGQCGAILALEITEIAPA